MKPKDLLKSLNELDFLLKGDASPDYVALMEQLKDAIDSGDEDSITAIKTEMQKYKEKHPDEFKTEKSMKKNDEGENTKQPTLFDLMNEGNDDEENDEEENDDENRPKTDEERAMTHFNIAKEKWENLSDEEKQEYISKLPSRGSKTKFDDEEVEKCNTKKKSIDSSENSEEEGFKKSMEDDYNEFIDVSEFLEGMVDKIDKSLTNISKSLKNETEALKQKNEILEKGLIEVIKSVKNMYDEFENRIKEIETTPQMRKSVNSYIQNKEIKKGSMDKEQILAKLRNEITKGNPNFTANDIINFEMSGEITPKIQSLINE